MENREPQQDRFKEYTEAEDGSGFYLDDNPHFFAFDEFGGWFDEYGNYYNSEGKSAPPPKPAEDVAEEDLEDEDDELDDDELSDQDPIDFEDNLIDDYEQGALIGDDEFEEVEEYDEETENLLSMNLERDGLKLKIDQLLAKSEPLLEFLVVSRLPENSSKVQGAVTSLGIPFVKVNQSLKGVYVDVTADQGYDFMDKAFAPGFYDKFSVHLWRDEDDQLPDKDDDTANQGGNKPSLEKAILKRFKPSGARKPLTTSSAVFVPEDKQKASEAMTSPDAPQPSQPKPKQSGGTRKRLQDPSEN